MGMDADKTAKKHKNPVNKTIKEEDLLDEDTLTEEQFVKIVSTF